MTNLLLEPEADAATISRILKHQIKELRKYKRTTPFHGPRQCEDRERCAFHRRKP